MSDWQQQRTELIRHHKRDLQEAVWYTAITFGLIGIALGMWIGVSL